jgi:signal transduction histidine kinase
MRPALLVLIFIPFAGFTQDHFEITDDLSSERLDTLYYSMMKDTIDTDLDQALIYAKSAIKHAVQVQNHEIMIRANYALGSVFIMKTAWDSAENYLKIARNLSYENKIYHRLPWIYAELGLIYVKTTKFDLAIDSYIEAIKFSKKYDDQRLVAIYHNEIGVVHLRLENYEEALWFFRKAILLMNDISLNEGMQIYQLNIAICLNATGKYYEALNILSNILLECNHCIDCLECSKSGFFTNLFNELGLSYQKLNNPDSAKKYFYDALGTIDMTCQFLLPITYGFLADVYFDENSIDSAHYYLEKSDRAAERINDVRTLIFNKFLLSEIYEKKALFREANATLREAMDIKNKNFPATMSENIRKSYVDFERYQSQQVIEAKEKIIKRNIQLNIMLGITSILSVLTFFLVYKNASIRKKINEKLSDEVYERTRELNSLLYRTSHDLAGPLARMKGLLRLINDRISEKETLHYLSRLNLTTDNFAGVISRLESISKISITPLKKEKIDLGRFMEDIITEIKSGHDLDPDVNMLGNNVIVTDKYLLGQIVHNILQNSYNHIDQRENAQKIFIEIVNDKNLNIIIGDTGTGILDGQEKKIFDLFFSGFDKNERAGIGLYFATVAVKRLGGSISLKRKRKPTLFEIKIPNSSRTLKIT